VGLGDVAEVVVDDLRRSGGEWLAHEAAVRIVEVHMRFNRYDAGRELGALGGDIALVTDLSEGRTDRFVLYLFDTMHLEGST
jgi:hypothetical protein